MLEDYLEDILVVGGRKGWAIVQVVGGRTFPLALVLPTPLTNPTTLEKLTSHLSTHTTNLVVLPIHPPHGPGWIVRSTTILVVSQPIITRELSTTTPYNSRLHLEY